MLVLVALALALSGQQSAPTKPKPSQPLGTFDDPNAGQGRPLQSVGVRGTIDAGGYAASTTLKTQTEFYERLSMLQVAVLRPAWAPQHPCAGSNALRTPATALLARNEFASAAAALETLLHTNSEPATHQLLGLADEGVGQLEAAAEQFRIAAAVQPDAAARFAYGAALLLLGQVDSAEALFRSSTEQTGGLASLAKIGLGAAMFQKGHSADALGLFLDAASAQSGASIPYEFIATAIDFADPGSLAHLIDVLSSLTRISPKNGSAHYAVACALMAAAGGAPDASQIAKIEAELKEALALDPSLADAHFRLASVYAARKDLPPAIFEYRAALDHNPRLAEAHYRLSQLYTRSGQSELAGEQIAVHRQLRAQQKHEIESGILPVRITGPEPATCPE